MKHLNILSAILFSCFVLAGIQACEASMASNVENIEISSQDESFQRSVHVQIVDYDNVKIKNVSLEHKREEDNGEVRNYIVIKGAVVNVSWAILTEPIVTAYLLNDKGQVLDQREGIVSPRILHRRGTGNRGYFSVETEYDPTIAVYKLIVKFK